ncbi:MAG: signal peptidase I [bacterium]|nr:signal peptidase I [bacterium]MDZ4284823.1 signal peptidase I [Patescibacteria group bacterium]
MVRRLLIRLIKVAAYVAFVVAAIYFTPKILAKVLDTPYPLATITSGSMWPVLKVNDLILMKGIAGSEASVGEIIVYRNPRGFTIHRLVEREEGKLITRGDANDTDDQPILESDVIGRIVSIGTWPVRIPHFGIIARKLGPKIQKFSDM